MNEIHFAVDEEFEGLRLDLYLAEMMDGKSRNYMQKLIAENLVTVNERYQKNRYLLQAGDMVTVNLPEPRILAVVPESIPLEIVYEDKSLLVVNKPQNMVVHPGAGNESGTLVNALMYHCRGQLSTINGIIRPGIVHRIDKDTSGLLVVAKNDQAHQGLAAQLSAHTMLRVYEGIAVGRIMEERIKVDAPIGRHPHQRQKMAVNPTGRHAVTHLKVRRIYQAHTLVEARLETGRTHQIRVHLAYIHHPILGDERYGGSQQQFKLNGQLLHAASLGFVHPISGEDLCFHAPAPAVFRQVLRVLEEDEAMTTAP